MSAHRPDPASPWVISIRRLGRRAGSTRRHTGTAVAADDLGLDMIGVPAGAGIELDLRLEAVTEGVYVSGTARAPLAGQCARCLDPLTDEITVPLGELFAYPGTLTDSSTEKDEVSRVEGEAVDVEPMARDAIVLALPLAPLCGEGCLGLCPDCGGKRAELGPGHRHDTMDPRWAALRGYGEPGSH